MFVRKFVKVADAVSGGSGRDRVLAEIAAIRALPSGGFLDSHVGGLEKADITGQDGLS